MKQRKFEAMELVAFAKDPNGSGKVSLPSPKGVTRRTSSIMGFAWGVGPEGRADTLVERERMRRIPRSSLETSIAM